MRFLKSSWTPFFLTLLIGVTLNVEAARNFIGDMLQLRPATLPSSGKNGMLRVDSSDNKLKKYNESTSSWEEISGTGAAGGGGFNVLAASNFNFEDSTTAVTPWTETGSGAFTTETGAANVGFGDVSGNCDGAAVNDKCLSEAVAVPNGLEGQSCLLEIHYRFSGGTDGHYSFRVEDGAGNPLSGDLDPTAGTAWNKAQIFFTCPTSGNIQAVVETNNASAASILLDEVYLGSNRNEFQVNQSELAVDAEYPATLNCFGWTRTNTVSGAFATDADCPAITVNESSANVVVDTTDDDLPTLKFTSLPPGKYTILAFFSAQIVTGGAEATFVLRDTTNSLDLDLRGFSDLGTNQVTGVELSGAFEQTTTGARNFEIYGYSSTGQIQVSNGTVTGFDPQLKFQVIRHPTDAQTATIIEGSGPFLVDANIGGANVSVPVTSVSTYTNLNSASLDLVVNNGSAFIACNGTEIASGSTCTADETVGIAFTPEKTLRYEVCMEFTHRITNNSTGDARHTFQLIKRQNNDDTVLEAEGGSRPQARHQDAGVGVSTTTNFPMHVCGEFELAGGVLHTIDLMMERSNNGSVNSAAIEADRSAGEGQRDIHVTVRPVFVADSVAIKASNDVVSPRLNGVRVVSATIDYQGTGVPVVDDEFGSWIDSITDTAVGDGTVNFVTGTFSDVPHCWCGGNDNVFLNCQGLRFPDTTQTSFRYRMFDDTGTLFDPVSAGEGVSVFCMGPK